MRNLKDMKKKGPCRHCGIETTPLWRNGPEDKPVLCNACGSRYRLCGSLDAYLPKHFHTGLLKNLENLKDNGNLNVRDIPSTPILPNSGSTTPSFWDTKIPSRKRSRVIYRRITPIEKFQNQLYNMWRLYGNPDEPEEVLLHHNVTNNFIPSDEIGLGAVLLKPDNKDTPSYNGRANY